MHAAAAVDLAIAQAVVGRLLSLAHTVSPRRRREGMPAALCARLASTRNRHAHLTPPGSSREAPVRRPVRGNSFLFIRASPNARELIMRASHVVRALSGTGWRMPGRSGWQSARAKLVQRFIRESKDSREKWQGHVIVRIGACHSQLSHPVCVQLRGVEVDEQGLVEAGLTRTASSLRLPVARTKRSPAWQRACFGWPPCPAADLPNARPSPTPTSP